MAVKIRLQRHGRKGRPFYWIVATDSRTKRDGKFLEKLGTYNPIKNPAIIELNLDSAVKWLKYGAQPSETARRILSYKGVLLKHHLQIGVDKGAITQEQADEKFNLWLEEKNNKINAKKQEISNIRSKKEYERLELEKKKALLRQDNSTEETEDPNSENTPKTTGEKESPKDANSENTPKTTGEKESPKDANSENTPKITGEKESLKDTQESQTEK